MNVKMKAEMSGTRNGEPWPPLGGEIELPDNEGAKLCASGLATPVAKKDETIERREAQKAEKEAEEQRAEAERQQAEAERQQAAAQADAKPAAPAKPKPKPKPATRRRKATK